MSEEDISAMTLTSVTDSQANGLRQNSRIDCGRSASEWLKSGSPQGNDRLPAEGCSPFRNYFQFLGTSAWTVTR